MDASNVPLHFKPEVNSENFEMRQKPTIETADELETSVEVVDSPVPDDYADALAFNEEPVTIFIQPSSDKNAQRFYDVWVNGRGAEILDRGHWVVATFLPVGRRITTKRKYVEALAKARREQVYSNYVQRGLDVENPIEFQTSAVASFTVLEDKNPRGQAWLQHTVYFG